MMRIRIASFLGLILVWPTLTLAADDALFEFDGKRYGPEEVSTRMQQLYGNVVAEQYRAMRSLVDEMVFDVYVEQEAKKSGRPVLEVGQELLAVSDPTETEARAFYQNNQASIGQPYEAVHEQIKRHLKRQALIGKRSEILTRIKSEGNFQILLEAPAPPPIAIDTRGRPVKGDPSAPITLIEFSDYQCPNCKRAVKVMERLLTQYPDKVKLVQMDFPINPSGVSRQVAHGAVCAQSQGKFWPYHDLAFDRQESLSMDSPATLAESLGLDMDRFAACMTDPSTRQKVQASESEARRLGLNATPTLFVDGRPFPSQHLLRDLGDYIASKTRDNAS
jgi:protein-disulfide isomerase